MIESQGGHESATPTGPMADEGTHLCDAIIDATTNTLTQEFAQKLKTMGLSGGLRDSRALRSAIRQIVSENVRNMDVHDIGKAASSVGLFPSRTGV